MHFSSNPAFEYLNILQFNEASETIGSVHQSVIEGFGIAREGGQRIPQEKNDFSEMLVAFDAFELESLELLPAQIQGAQGRRFKDVLCFGAEYLSPGRSSWERNDGLFASPSSPTLSVINSRS